MGAAAPRSRRAARARGARSDLCAGLRGRRAPHPSGPRRLVLRPRRRGGVRLRRRCRSGGPGHVRGRADRDRARLPQRRPRRPAHAEHPRPEHRLRRATAPDMTFVSAGFEPPRRLATEKFLLEPLGPEHNEGDYEAWTSSIEHIRSTPGFEDQRWPREMTVEENQSDLERHAADFKARKGFTFTVREPDGGAILGCVY